MGALTSFYRSFLRHRLFAALNIGGLALGVAVFLVLFLFVRFETGFDRVLPGWDKLWVIQERNVLPGVPPEPNPNTMGNELIQLKGDFPDLVGSRFNYLGATVRQGAASTAEQFAVVDTNFFTLFPHRALAGDPARTLLDPNGLVITRRTATKYFGAQPAIGRTLKLVIQGDPYLYHVGAVIENPSPQLTYSSDLYAAIVPARFANEWWDHWGSTSLTTFLKFPDADAARRFEAALPGFLDRHAFPPGNLKKGQFFQLITPVSDLHLASAGDRAVVATLAIVGLLTLLVAVVNYVNLATARAGLRAREVALRKVLGGARVALVAQFLGEAVATVALAALFGLALAELALPLINAAGGTDLHLHYLGADGVLFPLVLTVLLVGLGAGAYPAAVLSSYRPAAVLAAARAPSGGRAGARLRQGLVVVQFAIAVAFAIGTAVMVGQVAHVRAADLGFRRDGLVIVRSFSDGALDHPAQDDIVRAFRATPGVLDVGVAQNAPGDQSMTNTDTVALAGRPEIKPTMMRLQIAPGYFSTFGTRLLAGRMLDPARGGDVLPVTGNFYKQTSTENVVLNETGARALGFTDPAAAIGQPLSSPWPMRIVGVVADMRFTGPREALRPTFYLLDMRRIPSSYATVRYAGTDGATMSARLEAAWKRVAPTVPFDARTVEQNLWENFYKQDAQRARLFTLGAVLAVVIGCLGLYGLAAFDTARRVREIGIRKTLGASTRDVLGLLLARFLVPVALANLLAWPVAAVAMRRWLSGFDDRVALSPWFFLAASAAALGVAVATVVGQAWRVARAEPARALRYE